jgi:GntR family transcriptional regulator, rspAB operon transcriptional repressor
VALLRDTIYEKIRHAILSCEFQPGQELREQVLAERYRVSRSPIRDSLLRLEQENLVTVMPRQGYRVNPIAVSDVDDLFGLRLLIGPACAAAAARTSGEGLQILDQFRGFADGRFDEQAFIAYKEAFERAVADSSGNRRMVALVRDVSQQFERLLRVALHHLDHHSIRTIIAGHESIIDAIQARDPNRASRVARHQAEATHALIRTALRLDEGIADSA